MVYVHTKPTTNEQLTVVAFDMQAWEDDQFFESWLQSSITLHLQIVMARSSANKRDRFDISHSICCQKSTLADLRQLLATQITQIPYKPQRPL